jgi:hypothetical protein
MAGAARSGGVRLMQRQLFFGVAVVAGAAVLAHPRGARAQDRHAPVALDVDACAGVDTPEVRRLVPIELGAPLVDGAVSDARETTRATVSCVPNQPALVRLEVRDPTTGKSLDRVITLANVPQADQARLVSISVVELVAASWGELRHASESVPHAVGATASPATRDLALTSAETHDGEAVQPRWRLFVVGSARHFSGLPHVVPGGGIAVARTTRWGFGVGGDLLVEGGAQPTSLGEVQAVLGSVGLMALGRAGIGRLTLESGLGARAGLVRLAGRGGSNEAAPVRTGSVSGTWLGPLVVLRALVTLPRSFVVTVGGELGWATSGALGRVEGAPDVGVRGAWWSALVGVGYGL